ncbi:MAG: DUF937 domain-containing protein [Steroidobacteraceae bacterium]|jgi:hypothetical protein|nr:DUF937 domain-containing protein [Steroidobacteraceae bacterium]
MNLLELVQAQLGDERIDRLAAVVAESGTATRRALQGAALPAVLAGLSGEFAGEAGAARLLELMRAGGHDGSLLANLDGALGGGAHTDALLNLGKGQLGAILGDRIDAVTELMAADTGMRRTSAVSLLGLLVPVVLAVLGRQLAQAGGASRLAGLLAGARPALAAQAAPGLPAALGVADLAAAAPASGAPAARAGSVWPWLIVPACTLAMFFALRSCQQGSMREAPAAPARAPAPAPRADPAPPGAAFPGPGSPTPTLPELATPPPSSEVPFPGPEAPPMPSTGRAPAATENAPATREDAAPR